MKIQDRDHAQNWAAQHLKYPFVLVDEEGNIHCLTKQEDAIAVVQKKKADKKTIHIVKGKLPGVESQTIKAETPTVKPENPTDAAK